MLSLLGVNPADPRIAFDAGGTTNYNAASQLLVVNATNLRTFNPNALIGAATGLGKPTTLSAYIDNHGNLIGGVPGNDLEVYGRLTVGSTVYDGLLLTGEITAFGFKDQGTVDSYDAILTVTGGLLASWYQGNDLVMSWSSENSTFNNNFNVNFRGGAKGELGTGSPIIQLAKLGDYVWEDLNWDGIQDANEPGVENVQVNLYNANTNTLVGTQFTDSTGYYLFDNLTPGDYYVQFVLPTGYQFTKQDVGSNSFDSDADPVTGKTTTISLPSGGIDLTWDAGIYRPAKLGDYVWEDLNANGQQDDGDTGIANVTVKLLDSQGNVLATTLTDSSGYYLFDNLTPGTYSVMFVAPAGYIPSPANVGSDVTDSDGVGPSLITATTTLLSGGVDLTLDQGFYRLAKLGDYVWEDLNANGQQDDGEPGIDGVIVELYDAATDILVATQVTDNGGYYLFEDLVPGSYYVIFAPVEGFVRTNADVGDDTTDSDASDTGATGVYTLASGDVDLTVDAGYYRLVKLGDFVWEDLNVNGQQDDDEPGVAGVTVHLLDSEGNILDTTVTDDDGYYLFDDLVPGTYAVQFIKPDGYNFTLLNTGDDETDSDANDTTLGITAFTTLLSGDSDLTLDLGLVRHIPQNPGIEVKKYTNGVYTADPSQMPQIVPGATVTWTYKVTNTGNVAFNKSQVSVVDDNGTPANLADDFSTASGHITLITSSDAGNDGILSPGETWIFTASGIAKNLSGGPVGSAITITTTGSSSGSGAYGNVRTFTSGGVSVKVSAWSRNKTTNVFSDAYLGIFSGGLGVTDRTEGDGSSQRHTVDNVGPEDNYVLYRFSQLVVVEKITFGYVVNDSDFTYWIGTLPDAFNTSVVLNASVLASLGFSEVNLTGSSSTRTADINSGKIAGNVLVVAANIGESNPNDNFKIQNVVVRAAKEGGHYTNYALVTVPGALASDSSSYRNPEIAPKPGISIEKLTNGLYIPNASQAPALTPGSTVVWTYKVTNTGNVTYTLAQVNLTDDAGTPGNTADDYTIANGKIKLVASSDLGNDGLLSPGEIWLFTASDVVQNLGGPTGVPITLSMKGSSSLSGTAGNIRTFTASGITVKASAWSRDKSSGAFSSAYLGLYGGGLGVTDGTEGNGSGDGHTVDNMGRHHNYILFQLSENVVLDKVRLGYVVGDSDFSLWIGTVPNGFNNKLSLNAALLSSLGFYEVNNTSSSSARTASVNAGQVSGNVIVIAAAIDDPNPNDRFKLEQLIVQKLKKGGVYTNQAVVTVPGASHFDSSWYTNTVLPSNLLSGFVYEDDNGNGIKDTGEAGIKSVTIRLVHQATNLVVATATTDNNGYYQFKDIAPGTYRLVQVQPQNYLDGKDAIGTQGGTTGNDVLSNIVVTSTTQGKNNNFGEVSLTYVAGNQTGTIDFWQSKNGQNLILSLNGSQSSKKLGNWLASNFANLYGSKAGSYNMANKTNKNVAALFKTLYNQKGNKLEAQLLAVALAMYVTDPALAGGNYGAQYGFQVGSPTLAAAVWNVGKNGKALGLADNTATTVWDLLKRANSRASKGTLHMNNATLRGQALNIFSGINNKK